MHDQAAGLRRLMGREPPFQALGVFGTDIGLTATACGQLALALARRGAPAWVFDEAAPPRNVAAGFGRVSRLSLGTLLRQGGDPGEALLPIAPGVSVLAAEGGLRWLGEIGEHRWRAVAAAMAAIAEQPRWLLLHPAAGQESASLASCTVQRVLVLPQRKAHLTHAYALLKSVQQSHPADRWQVLVLQATSDDAALELYGSLAATARRFLGLELEWLGGVRRDRDAGPDRPSRESHALRDHPTPGATALAFRRLAEALAGRSACGMGDSGCQPEEFWLKMWMLGRLAAEAAMENVQNVLLDRSYG